MIMKDTILDSIVKHFKSQPNKTLTVKDFDKFPSSYLMDNWNKVKKTLEQQGFKVKASTRIAMEITAGGWKPPVFSNVKTSIVLRESDFKDPYIFHGIMEQLGLHQVLQNELAKLPKTDEPEITHTDYDEITIKVSESNMQ